MAATATLSLPKIFPNHPITRRLQQVNQRILLSSLPPDTNIQNPPQSKDLCLNPEKLAHQSLLFHPKSASLPLTVLALPFLVDPQDAAAVGGGIWDSEGRSFALIHPIVMGGLFLYKLYAGYLGLQWRRVRTIQDEINELKKQDKKPADGDQPPAEPSPLQSKILQLTEERKELIKGCRTEINTSMLAPYCWDLECLNQSMEGSTPGSGLESYSPDLIYSLAQVFHFYESVVEIFYRLRPYAETARSLHIALNSLNVLLFVSHWNRLSSSKF